MTAAAELATHLTGEYPPWWKGRKFVTPIRAWTGAETNEASRDIVQLALLGPEGAHGTGWIPLDKIVEVKYRQAGVPNVVDTIKVRHKSGGVSDVTLKTYDQGRAKWQGTSKHVVWLDEEPPQDIYTEAQTRTLDVKGMILLTFTPLKGASQVVKKFLAGGDGLFKKNVTWEDAPHLDKTEMARLAASYPEWERDTRTKGIPIMGSGLVYPIDEKQIRIEPFEIPAHFARITGIDFGWDHPAAVSHIAWDRDQDIIYVTKTWRERNAILPVLGAAIKSCGPYPVAWPHDGMKAADPKTGKPMKDLLKSEGILMTRDSARYDDKIGGSQPRDPIVHDILQRMRTGRFKVFSTCSEFFEELRMYHREDGRIVAVDDDTISSVHYAVMMKRKAMMSVVRGPKHRQRRQIVGGLHGRQTA